MKIRTEQNLPLPSGQAQTLNPEVVAVKPCDKQALHQALEPKAVSLLSDDHAKYCLEIKKKINPESKDFSLVYGASGPDLSVPLLSTNATEILCLDNHMIDLNKLNEALNKGSAALYDTHEIPLDLHSGLGHSPDRPQEFLESSLEARVKHGYWLASNINTVGFERCIAIELDKLGVPLTQVSLGGEKGEPFFIEFPWAFPGEAAKKRKVYFQTAKLPGALSQVDFSKYHAYLQKSGMNAQNKKPMRKAIAELLKTASKDFFVLTGKPLEKREQVHAKNVRSYFGDQAAESMRDLDLVVPKASYSSYGQQMLLAQVL